MGGFEKKRLVLIHSTFKGNDGQDTHKFGTGYFVTNDLVLTASHVLAGAVEQIEVRLEDSQISGRSPWVEGEKNPVWENARLDAALIKVTQPIGDVEAPCWGQMDFKEDTPWTTTAYPEASSQKVEGRTQWKTSGLKGTLYAHGGGGQGIRDLELGVADEPKSWNGVSGAPVFVGDQLVGIIKSTPQSYEQRRLAAVPIDLLLRDPGFRTAIAPKWLAPLPEKTWVLVLVSENGNVELTDIVQTAIQNRFELINGVTGQAIDDEPRVVNVTETLESPERFFQFVQTICAAPIMVFDVTGFQPAVMLFLGIRAVVRRGITITTTTEPPNESSLSELPFNIQETKLIYISSQYSIDHARYPVNWIGSTILSGLVQLKNDPGYLDLPAYDAVRRPEPKDLAGMPSLRDHILMLCSFNRVYKNHWDYVSNKIIINKSTIKPSPKLLERMIDISSPRLVGQALYESIRWTPCCIVDWTHWRPNVFFELGVRYACSDIGPICLIEENEKIGDGEDVDLSATTAPNHQTVVGEASSLTQRRRLLTLFDPIVYKLGGPSEPFKTAFARYNGIINGQEVVLEHSAIAHNGTYQTIVNSYYWAQESITNPPHTEIRANIEVQFGKDPQREGTSQILFSTNSEFANELTRNVQERWIAAWSYFRSRYTLEEFRSNQDLREQLIALGEEVAQWLSKSLDSNHKRIHGEIIDLIDELEIP